MAIWVPNGSSASAPSRSAVVAGLPFGSRQSARDREWALGRIGNRVQLIDAAPHDGFAPHLVEIRHQGRHRRHRGMQIAIDRRQFGHGFPRVQQ